MYLNGLFFALQKFNQLIMSFKMIAFYLHYVSIVINIAFRCLVIHVWWAYHLALSWNLSSAVSLGAVYSVLCFGDKYLQVSRWRSDHTRRPKESGTWSDNRRHPCCNTGANIRPPSGAKYAGIWCRSQWRSCCLVWWLKLLGQQPLAKR